MSEELQTLRELLGVPTVEIPEGAGKLASQVRDLKKRISSGGAQADEDPDPDSGVGDTPDDDYATMRSALREAARILNVGMFSVSDRVNSLQNEIQQLREQLEQFQATEQVSAEDLLAEAEQFGHRQVPS